MQKDSANWKEYYIKTYWNFTGINKVKGGGNNGIYKKRT